MAEKIPGSDLEAGQYFKQSGRTYLVLGLEDGPPRYSSGTQLGKFQASDGSEHNFLIYNDSMYELATRPRPRIRMVKVRADDIKILIEGHADIKQLEDAVARLREAIQ